MGRVASPDLVDLLTKGIFSSVQESYPTFFDLGDELTSSQTRKLNSCSKSDPLLFGMTEENFIKIQRRNKNGGIDLRSDSPKKSGRTAKQSNFPFRSSSALSGRDFNNENKIFSKAPLHKSRYLASSATPVNLPERTVDINKGYDGEPYDRTRVEMLLKAVEGRNNPKFYKEMENDKIENYTYSDSKYFQSKILDHYRKPKHNPMLENTRTHFDQEPKRVLRSPLKRNPMMDRNYHSPNQNRR